jgi:hypothetical protein
VTPLGSFFKTFFATLHYVVFNLLEFLTSLKIYTIIASPLTRYLAISTSHSHFKLPLHCDIQHVYSIITVVITDDEERVDITVLPSLNTVITYLLTIIKCWEYKRGNQKSYIEGQTNNGRKIN